MAIGPEIFSYAATDSIVKKVAVGSSVGAQVGAMVLKSLSDSQPSLIDPVGLKNLYQFYPAGCST